MSELARLGWHFRQTENECTTQICRTEKAWQAPQPLYQFRYLIAAGRDLELQVEHWRSRAEKEHEDASREGS